MQAELIRRAKIIIWDEAPMLRKQAFECVDRLLRDLMKSIDSLNEEKLFGGKLIVFGGDYRQILPVIRKGSPRDIIDNSLKNSYIWPNLHKFKLTENMRLINNPESEQFSQYLLEIGEGRITMTDGKIIMPHEICSPLDSFDEFIDNIILNNTLNEWTILATKNEVVDEINSKILSKISGNSRLFLSSDSVVETEYQKNFPIEFLNTVNNGGLAPHRLSLKKNCRVILMRNLNPSLGLCNGTQLKIIEYKNNLILAENINNTSENNVFIPRIDMTTCDSGLPFTLKRRQYPIRPAYALTINKSQGQTLNKVAIYLKDECFSHGQLYVAMSRVRSKDSLKIFTAKSRNKYVTKNVVYHEILND